MTIVVGETSMKIINLTPHAVTLMNGNNIVAVYQPSGQSARLKETPEWIGELGEIPLYKVVYGEPEGLPPQKEGVYYIVSAMIKDNVPNRTDLLVPYPQVRNEKGMIIGCTGMR